MFRSEPSAAFRVHETTRPDRKHRGVSFVERTYFLTTGAGRREVELSRGLGEVIAAGQRRSPQPICHLADRHWWLYRGRVYSTTDRLSPAVVHRLAERERGQERERPLASGSGRARHDDHVTA